MGIPCWDDVVLIGEGKNPGDPTVVTVNCPDKAGLGCDLSRIRTLYYPRRDLLHTKKRRDDTCKHLSHEIGHDCVSCELRLAGPEYESQQGFSSLSEAVHEELFSCELSDSEPCSQALSADMTRVKKATITVDNYMSPAHTLLQIQCVDQKGLIYDILRTAKDCNIQVFQDFSWKNLSLCERLSEFGLAYPENRWRKDCRSGASGYFVFSFEGGDASPIASHHHQPWSIHGTFGR